MAPPIRVLLPPQVNFMCEIPKGVTGKLEVQKKVMAEVPKVDGKSPCYGYFINGSCKDGANCKFHHQGRSAGYKIG